MYNLNYNLRELPGIPSFPPIGFIPKSFRSKIDFFKFNQLPPIQEEEGNSSQSEIELKNIPSYSSFTKNDSCKNDFNSNKTSSNTKSKSKKSKRTKNEEPFQCFPPVLNISCHMNVDMKQQQHIWKTSFAKRLINGRACIPETMSLPAMKKTKKSSEKIGENQRSKSADSSRSFFSDKNIQLGLEDKITYTKEKKAKPVRVQKKPQKREGRKSKEQKRLEISTASNNSMPKTESEETSVKTVLPHSESLSDSLTTSNPSRSQNLLSHCVQRILGGKTAQNNCIYCDEIFTNVAELNGHLEKHEREKEVCVLCNKVFFKPNEFVQHLLTHESVDKFSCKKCKKYFPTLRKYKMHCKEFHLKSSESIKTENNCNLDSIKNWTPKYECKRCQMELDSEEDFRLHKRNHIRLDLMGAYLLSNKSI